MPIVRITRSVSIPDRFRLARFRRAPELGPHVLFFSGGTALRSLSQELVGYTHNSVHLITPFDSGGSSAEIRKAFGMLAVGDLRNRLMALADRSMTGNPQIFELFATRLPKDADHDALFARLNRMIAGKDHLVAAVPDPMRKIVRNHLRYFAEAMPEDFDLRGASIGNLILTGGYVNNNRQIDPVIYLFSKLAEVRGTVRPVSGRDLHLVAELEDGTVLAGQHLLTGKETAPIASPVKRVYLSQDARRPEPARAPIRRKIRDLVHGADLICYPMGSFYSSLVANLLPHGVGQAVADTPCPKVYVPNMGKDPEQLGMGVFNCVSTLLRYLQAGCDGPATREDLLNFVLVDTARGVYPGPLELDKVRRYGVEVIDAPLVSDASAPLIDSALLAEVLLSLV
jgi:CofD-related protein of GAK system